MATMKTQISRNDPTYDFADKQIKRIEAFIAAQFTNTVNRMVFDELNVVDAKRITSAMFNRMVRFNRKRYAEIFKKAWCDAEKELIHKGYTPGPRPSDEEVNKALDHMLKAYDPVTGYVYNREVNRKRDRLTEGIVSHIGDERGIRDQFRTGMGYFFGQSRQYADNFVEYARLRAFDDGGVEEVRWVSERDSRVCSICQSLDGEIFEIHNVPAHPHWRCRCRVEPV